MAGIKVPDELLDSAMWREEKFSRGQAYIEMMRIAARKTDTRIYNYKLRTFRRGCIYKSNSMLSATFHWSNTKVTSFLQELQEMGKIRVIGRGIEREIEMLEYDAYQLDSTESSNDYFVMPGGETEESEEETVSDDDSSWFDAL